MFNPAAALVQNLLPREFGGIRQQSEQQQQQQQQLLQQQQEQLHLQQQAFNHPYMRQHWGELYGGHK